MDLGRTLRRAWEITWRYKVLWLFGFLVALTSGGGNGGGSANTLQYRVGPNDVNWGPMAWTIILALIVVAIVIGLIIAVLGIIASGALIDGVRQAEASDSVSGREAWRAGTSRFWPLLALRLLVFVIGIALLLPLFLCVAGSIFAGIATQEPGPAIIPMICGLLLYLLPMIAAFVVLGLVTTYADRAIMLEQLGAVEAIKRAWDVLRRHIGETILIGVILLVINAVIGAITFGGLVAVGVPSILTWITTQSVPATAVPLCGLGLLWLLISLAITAIVQTYSSTLWTLTYRQLTARTAVAAPAPPTELEL